MGTRGGIVRVTGNGTFKGRYHGFDSYPEGLGKTLWELYRERHNKNLDAMLKELIDDHPAGWSSINEADWSVPPGYGGRSRNDKSRAQCYCHGERSEDVQDVTEANAAHAGCEYVYAFDKEDNKDIMLVLASYVGERKMIGMFGMGNPNAEWKVIGKIDLEEDSMPKLLRGDQDE